MTAGEDRMNLRKSKIHYLLAIAVCTIAFTAAALSQVTPTPPATPPTRGVKPKIKIKPPKIGKEDLPPNVEMGAGTTTERSIAVDPRVSLSLCVNEGTVKINGWSRNEVRTFIENGNKFAFRVLQRSAKGDPALISIVGIRQLPGGSNTTADCISGEDIELDVPENAALSIKGRETETSVDTVRKVVVTNVGGDINIKNVAEGVTASTYRGEVTVENSRGAMALDSSSGNVVAYSVSPADVGDSFRAKTNSGNISLEKLGYRLADVNSISGTVLYAGELMSGGSFSFRTTNGAIRLILPENSSCRITATYGYGDFNNDFPVKGITNNVAPGPVKTVNAVIGSGDAVLRLITNNGSIAIKKQP